MTKVPAIKPILELPRAQLSGALARMDRKERTKRSATKPSPAIEATHA